MTDHNPNRQWEKGKFEYCSMEIVFDRQATRKSCVMYDYETYSRMMAVLNSSDAYHVLSARWINKIRGGITMTNKQRERLERELNDLDKRTDRYWEKMDAALDAEKYRRYSELFNMLSAELDGMIKALDILGYGVKQRIDDPWFIYEK